MCAVEIEWGKEATGARAKIFNALTMSLDFVLKAVGSY